MFWTWLWGTLGLLLSTPLTVCLAVLGKYVPSLRFFATLLGEEAELEPDVRFYQRLVALDRDGAVEVVEAALKQRPRVEVFDQVLVPALSRAERDAARDELDEAEQAFVWRVVGEILDGLEGVPDLSLASPAPPTARRPGSGDGASAAAPVPLVGLAVRGHRRRPGACGCWGSSWPRRAAPWRSSRTPSRRMQVAERVAEQSPELVVVSHLPPEGLTSARYLVRRLRAQFADLPIVVGRWGETGGARRGRRAADGIGASHVVFTLAEARDRILKAGHSRREAAAVTMAGSR